MENHWEILAECKGVDPDLFYPERGDTSTERAAKAVCELCLVKEDCLDFALTNTERHGIWGGTSERQRRRIRRERNRADTTPIEY